MPGPCLLPLTRPQISWETASDSGSSGQRVGLQCLARTPGGAGMAPGHPLPSQGPTLAGPPPGAPWASRPYIPWYRDQQCPEECSELTLAALFLSDHSSVRERRRGRAAGSDARGLSCPPRTPSSWASCSENVSCSASSRPQLSPWLAWPATVAWSPHLGLAPGLCGDRQGCSSGGLWASGPESCSGAALVWPWRLTATRSPGPQSTHEQGCRALCTELAPEPLSTPSVALLV